jgi:GNAT superfamily N-acetyltransferase/ribosomal protein S18 acetylase RimI-like enzyme
MEYSTERIATLTTEQQRDVVAFWAAMDVRIPAAQATPRLAAVKVLARDADGRLVGVASAPVGRPALLNRTPVYMFRFLVRPDGRGRGVAARMLACFANDAARRFAVGDREAMGIFTEMAGQQLDGDRPLARSRAGDLHFYFVAAMGNGRRARVAWFDGARISNESSGSPEDPLRALAPGYEMFVVADGMSEAWQREVIAIWGSQSQLDAAQIRARMSEVHVLTLAPDGSVCGIMTAYPQTGMPMNLPMHAARAFVLPAHRRRNIPALMCARFLDDLQARYEAGIERESFGMFTEVQSESIRVFRNDAVWPATDAAFVGVTREGYHLRASYLVGKPLPPGY